MEKDGVVRVPSGIDLASFPGAHALSIRTTFDPQEKLSAWLILSRE